MWALIQLVGFSQICRVVAIADILLTICGVPADGGEDLLRMIVGVSMASDRFDSLQLTYRAASGERSGPAWGGSLSRSWWRRGRFGSSVGTRAAGSTRAGTGRPRRARWSSTRAGWTDPVLDEPGPPLADRHDVTTQLLGHLRVVQPVGTSEDDLRPQRQRLRRLRPPSPPPQLHTINLAQHQLGLPPPSSRPTPSDNYSLKFRRRTLDRGFESCRGHQTDRRRRLVRRVGRSLGADR